jgi:hypothetical protein
MAWRAGTSPAMTKDGLPSAPFALIPTPAVDTVPRDSKTPRQDLI